MSDRNELYSGVIRAYYDELSSILALVELPAARGEERDASTEKTLFQAAHVLAVAQTEGFTKQVVAEYADKLNASGVPLRRLPDELRHLHTRQAVEDLAACADDTQGSRARSLMQLLDRYWDDDRVVPPSANPSKPGLISRRKLQAQVSAINELALRSLLEILGCSVDVCGRSVELVDEFNLRRTLAGDLLDDGERRDSWDIGTTTMQVGDKLSDLVAKRNTIAHGNGRVDLTRQDMIDTLSFLCGFATIMVEAMRITVEGILTLA